MEMIEPLFSPIAVPIEAIIHWTGWIFILGFMIGDYTGFSRALKKANKMMDKRIADTKQLMELMLTTENKDKIQ